MSDYSKFLSNLTDQLGLLQGLSPKGFGGLGGLGNLGNNLGNLGNNLGNLRPAHKALMCVGAATVACVDAHSTRRFSPAHKSRQHLVRQRWQDSRTHTHHCARENLITSVAEPQKTTQTAAP